MDCLILKTVSSKQDYYIKKYRLKTTMDSNGNIIVYGNFNDVVCPGCKCILSHPLSYENHLIYSKCKGCIKKFPMHFLFEFGGIQDCGCYCYDCMVDMNCCFRKDDWRKCNADCPLCRHNEYCTHSNHTLQEIFKCELCKDYI
jgi:hypothetical protein